MKTKTITTISTLKHLHSAGVLFSLLATLVSATAAKADIQTRHSSTTSLKTADTGAGLKRIRRAAVGLSVGGALGVGGLNLELVPSPDTSFLFGFGSGSGYQAFTFQVKKALAGDSPIIPYVSGGISRWYTYGLRGNPISETNPSFLTEKFLSEDEKRSGVYSKLFLHPGAGIQYFELSGPWAGHSLYLEVLLLVDLQKFVDAAAGSVGYLYYF